MRVNREEEREVYYTGKLQAWSKPTIPYSSLLEGAVVSQPRNLVNYEGPLEVETSKEGLGMEQTKIGGVFLKLEHDGHDPENLSMKMAGVGLHIVKLEGTMKRKEGKPQVNIPLSVNLKCTTFPVPTPCSCPSSCLHSLLTGTWTPALRLRTRTQL